MAGRRIGLTDAISGSNGLQNKYILDMYKRSISKKLQMSSYRTWDRGPPSHGLWRVKKTRKGRVKIEDGYRRGEDLPEDLAGEVVVGW